MVTNWIGKKCAHTCFVTDELCALKFREPLTYFLFKYFFSSSQPSSSSPFDFITCFARSRCLRISKGALRTSCLYHSLKHIKSRYMRKSEFEWNRRWKIKKRQTWGSMQGWCHDGDFRISSHCVRAHKGLQGWLSFNPNNAFTHQMPLSIEKERQPWHHSAIPPRRCKWL